MKIFTEASLIKQELKRINPSRIAVAYIGIRWEEYLPPRDGLKEVILSPTIGSNPNAIDKLIERLGGYGNIHFLDKLHSKIYLSNKEAMFGSCNLSNNALTEGGLFEVAASTEDVLTLNLLHNLFEGYKTEANNQYPDERSKRKKLKWPHQKSNEAARSGFIKTTEAPPLIEDCGEPISIWHSGAHADLNEKSLILNLWARHRGTAADHPCPLYLIRLLKTAFEKCCVREHFLNCCV